MSPKQNGQHLRQRYIQGVLQGLAAFTPQRFPYLRFATALAIATAGGWTFTRLGLPLPWMLGAMAFCTVAALLQAPIEIPAAIRPPVISVIGVMLGSTFSPGVFAHLAQWLPTITFLFAYIAACGLCCVTYFHLVCGYDRPTAFFSGMPGGFTEMVMMGDEAGADPTTIALVHSARILFIVFALPFLVAYVEGVSFGARPQLGVSLFASPWLSIGWLLACAIVGGIVGHLLRLPAKYVLGPMLVSSIVHISGASAFVPPFEIVNASQVMFGAAIGCRFVGSMPGKILRVLGRSIGATLIMLAVTLLFAAVVSGITGVRPSAILLAYSPGGFAEMSLVALAMNLEVAFVATHHFIRILLVVLVARPLYLAFYR